MDTVGMERNQNPGFMPMSSHPINQMAQSGGTRANQLFNMEQNQLADDGCSGQWVIGDR